MLCGKAKIRANLSHVKLKLMLSFSTLGCKNFLLLGDHGGTGRRIIYNKLKLSLSVQLEQTKSKLDDG